MVIKDEQGNLYLSTHQHSWKYKPGADGKSITATCVNTTNCPNIDGGSVTIKAPEENTLIYDGSNKTAILENKLLTGEKDPQSATRLETDRVLHSLTVPIPPMSVLIPQASQWVV